MTEDNILKLMRLWAFENIKSMNSNSIVSRLVNGTADLNFVFCDEVNLTSAKFLLSVIRKNENIEIENNEVDIMEITNKYLGHLNK